MRRAVRDGRRGDRGRPGGSAWELAVLWAAVPALAAGGCSSHATLGQAGAVCAVTTDCAEGLVCLATAGGRRCSSDLTSIQDPTPVPEGGGVTPTGDAGSSGPVADAEAGVSGLDGASIAEGSPGGAAVTDASDAPAAADAGPPGDARIGPG